MSVELRKVENRRDMLTFVSYANDLYKGQPNYVPAMISDELATLDPKANGAYEFCECECWLAYKDGILAGRVAAIINHKANKAWNRNEVRYGWIDFIDDYEVSTALIDKVTEYGKERGCDEIAGPLGFTDFDPEGLLVEGYDRLATMVCRYHFPYYKEHFDRMGMTKVVDWLEFRIQVPEVLPERMTKIARIVQEKLDLRFKKITRRSIRKEKIGQKFFDLINETYSQLYGYSLLSQRQIDQYVKTYLQIIDLRMVSFIVDGNDEIVAAGVTMPSMSKALQKCNGKLFPLGWWYMVKNMFIKKDDTLDLLLIAVKPEYQNKGVNAMLFADLFPRLKDMGFKAAESNAELESNVKVQSQWQGLEWEQHKRRRIYGKSI